MFFVPEHVGLGNMQQSGIMAGNASAGSNLIETNLLEGNFIDA